MRRSLVIFLLATAFILVGSAGCGSNLQDYCEGLTKCFDGNDDDERACIVTQQGFENAAAAYGCSDEWDAWADCRAENSTCRGIGVNKTYDPSTLCNDKGTKYDNCQEDASNIPQRPTN